MTSARKQKTCPRCGLVKPLSQFVTIYGYENSRGKYCRQCFLDREQESVRALLDGRDFCLYCGKVITKAYDWTPEGRSKKTYINLDHMDPRYLGGDDSHENTVYCCTTCNARKGRKPFLVWLGELKAPYEELARRVYEEKHGRSPEEFEPKSTGLRIVIDLTHLQEES